ncbi:hypothetical protein BVJ60_03960 [Vibrio cholerae]|nr:hypothetical protein [Vibrio cholerae]
MEPQWLIEFTSSIECLNAHRDEFTDRLPATPGRLGIDLMLGRNGFSQEGMCDCDENVTFSSRELTLKNSP